MVQHLLWLWQVGEDPRVSVDPAAGMVGKGGRSVCRLCYNPHSAHTLSSYKVTCQVVNGSTYTLLLSGGATVFSSGGVSWEGSAELPQVSSFPTLTPQEVSHSSGSRWHVTAALPGQACCLAAGCAGPPSLELWYEFSLPSMQRRPGPKVLTAVQGWGTSRRWTSAS